MQPVDTLKRAGLQATAAQVAVLDYLQGAGHGHFSAEAIHREVSLRGHRQNVSTTYRVLSQLQAAGLIASVALGQHQSLYELDTGKKHDHLVCVVCGRIEEFSDPVINRRRDVIAKRFGLRFLGRTLALQGTCADCRKRMKRR